VETWNLFVIGKLLSPSGGTSHSRSGNNEILATTLKIEMRLGRKLPRGGEYLQQIDFDGTRSMKIHLERTPPAKVVDCNQSHRILQYHGSFYPKGDHRRSQER